MVGLLFLLAVGFTTLNRFYARKFLGTATRNAQWIWAAHRMSSRTPVVFFAARDFELPPTRRYTHVKIYGDPEYTLYFNGKEIASRRTGQDRRMDLYDVSTLAKDGRNRIVVAVRSTYGIGGLILGVDIEPEKENFVVSDADWKIFRVWRGELPHGDPAGVLAEPPRILGEPPFGRWNFLGVIRRPFSEPVRRVLKPAESVAVRAIVPTVREVFGVYVAGSEELRARAFDFGPTQGRARITLDRDTNVPRVINLRFANQPEELTLAEPVARSFVFAPGERTVTDPGVESFRYVLVLSPRATAEVAQ
jgi:hypothetical protein